MKSLEVKIEIWVNVEVSNDMTTEEALEKLKYCKDLSDVYDEFGEYELLDGDMNDCRLIVDKNCIYIDDKMYEYDFENGEYKLREYEN